MKVEELMNAVPSCGAGWAHALVDAMKVWGIKTPKQENYFIAQCAHETQGFTRFEENLNYSAQALMKTWPNRFPNLQAANQYARYPEGIANHVYANRLGNGNEASGDGWKYRGRGPIQITGRLNYQAAGKGINYPLERYPDDLIQPHLGAPSACWFWKVHDLNDLAEAGKFDEITRRINGGLNGLEDRYNWLSRVEEHREHTA